MGEQTGSLYSGAGAKTRHQFLHIRSDDLAMKKAQIFYNQNEIHNKYNDIWQAGADCCVGCAAI